MPTGEPRPDMFLQINSDLLPAESEREASIGSPVTDRGSGNGEWSCSLQRTTSEKKYKPTESTVLPLHQPTTSSFFSAVVGVAAAAASLDLITSCELQP